MKTLREKALEAAVESTLQRHAKFAHVGGDHVGDTVCWLEETVLVMALQTPEAQVDVEALLQIVEYFDQRADVKDSETGGQVPNEEMRHLETMRKLLELKR